MNETFSTDLDSMLADVANPTWSSHMLDQLFSEMSGNTKSKLQQILVHLDARFTATPTQLNETQVNFLRDVTVRSFSSQGNARFLVDDLDWLIASFNRQQLPQQALVLAMLIELDDLPARDASQIIDILAGTAGQHWASR